MSSQGMEVFLDELATSKEIVTQAASQGRAEEQDVIQITEQGHPFFAALLLVTAVTEVGVQAELSQATGESTIQRIPCTLSFNQFERIGRAVVRP